MNTHRQTITIPNGLYGDREVCATCAGGLGVHNLSKRWEVVHVLSGRSFAIGRGGDRRTRKGAMAVMQALLALPVDWSKPYEEIRADIEQNRKAIMLALATARNL